MSGERTHERSRNSLRLSSFADPHKRKRGRVLSSSRRGNPWRSYIVSKAAVIYRFRDLTLCMPLAISPFLLTVRLCFYAVGFSRLYSSVPIPPARVPPFIFPLPVTSSLFACSRSHLDYPSFLSPSPALHSRRRMLHILYS